MIELGFNSIAVAANYSAARRVTEYIVTGCRERADALTGLAFVTWERAIERWPSSGCSPILDTCVRNGRRDCSCSDQLKRHQGQAVIIPPVVEVAGSDDIDALGGLEFGAYNRAIVALR